MKLFKLHKKELTGNKIDLDYDTANKLIEIYDFMCKLSEFREEEKLLAEGKIDEYFQKRLDKIKILTLSPRSLYPELVRV